MTAPAVGPRAGWEPTRGADVRPEPVPLALPLSVSLLGNTNRGTLTADAEVVHRGRTAIVVDVGVSDGHDRLLARLTATQRTPGFAAPANR